MAKSEPSRNKTLFKNTIIISIGKLGTALAYFFLLPFYTAALEPAEYGIQDLIGTVSTILSIVFGLQLAQGVYRYLLDAREDKEKTAGVITNVLCIFFTSAAVLTVFFLITDAVFHPPYIWYVYALSMTYIFFSVGQEILRGENRYGEYALLGFILTVAILILNIVLVFFLRMGVRGLLLSSVVSYICLSVVLVFRCSLVSAFSLKRLDRSAMKDILAYSLPLVPNELSWWVIKGSDRMIVSAVFGVAANGIVSVAHKFPAAFILFYNYFNTSWTETVILHLGDDDHEAYISGMTNYVLRFALCLGAGIIAVMPFVFDIMVNVQYGEAYNQIPIYMLAMLFNVLVGLTSGLYVAKKNTKRVAQTAVAAALINIVVHLGTIKWIGIYAASISSLCAFIFFGLFRAIDTQKYCKIHYDMRFCISWIILLIGILLAYYTQIRVAQLAVLGFVIVFSAIANRAVFIKLLNLRSKKHAEKITHTL